MTPYAFCRVCKYAANSAAMWPCRCCSRINRMEDHFTPADEDADDLPTHGDEIRALGNNGLAELIIERFHIHSLAGMPVCVSRRRQSAAQSAQDASEPPASAAGRSPRAASSALSTSSGVAWILRIVALAARMIFHSASSPANASGSRACTIACIIASR